MAVTNAGHKSRAVFDRDHIVGPADLQETTRKLAGMSTGMFGPLFSG